MARLSDIKQFLDDLYETENIGELKTGIITRGKDQIKVVALCVNAAIGTIRNAIDSNADMLIAHNQEVLGEKSTEEKLSVIKDKRVTFYVTGASMDTHEVYGTDYLIAKAMGLESQNILDKKNSRGLYGISGIHTYPMFLRRINWLTHASSESYQNNSGKIRRIAIYAGKLPKADLLQIARDNNCDTFLCNCGDPALKTCAEDLKVNLFIANYTATEKLGLVALKKLIDGQFTIKTLILDEPKY